MKNNRENAGESFRKKVLSGIIYSLLITLIAEFFLVRNLLTAADYVHETDPDNSAAAALSDFRVVAVLLLLLFGICLFATVFYKYHKTSIYKSF